MTNNSFPRPARGPAEALPVLAESGVEGPSAWLLRWLPAVPPDADVLDLACGSGRHARVLAAAGFRVLAADRDAAALAALVGVPGIEVRCVDLECGVWPFADRRFAAIVVTRYLHRPLLPRLAASLIAGGLLIYETFMDGQQRFGRPSNPDFLLRRDELREFAGAAGLEVLGFEQSPTDVAAGPVTQAICCRRPVG